MVVTGDPCLARERERVMMEELETSVRLNWCVTLCRLAVYVSVKIVFGADVSVELVKSESKDIVLAFNFVG